MLYSKNPKTIHHANHNDILYPPIRFPGFLSTAVDITYRKYVYERGPEFFLYWPGFNTLPHDQ